MTKRELMESAFEDLKNTCDFSTTGTKDIFGEIVTDNDIYNSIIAAAGRVIKIAKMTQQKTKTSCRNINTDIAIAAGDIDLEKFGHHTIDTEAIRMMLVVAYGAGKESVTGVRK